MKVAYSACRTAYHVEQTQPTSATMFAVNQHIVSSLLLALTHVFNLTLPWLYRMSALFLNSWLHITTLWLMCLAFGCCADHLIAVGMLQVPCCRLSTSSTCSIHTAFNSFYFVVRIFGSLTPLKHACCIVLSIFLYRWRYVDHGKAS
jgi:hypothetical protein